eukprot:COSAG05_NODE_18273_length_311_cov_0.495283_1_plen_29_part_10
MSFYPVFDAALDSPASNLNYMVLRDNARC